MRFVRNIILAFLLILTLPSNAKTWWAKAKWIDFHMYQSGHRKYGQRMGNKDYPIPDNTEEDCWMYVDSTWAYKPVKPVIDGEPSYEDIPVGLHFPDGRDGQQKTCADMHTGMSLPDALATHTATMPSCRCINQVTA